MASQVAQNLLPMQDMQETRVQSLSWEDPRRRKWQPTPIFLPEKSHRQRSLVGYFPHGRKESGMTQHAHMNSQLNKYKVELNDDLHNYFRNYPSTNIAWEYVIFLGHQVSMLPYTLLTKFMITLLNIVLTFLRLRCFHRIKDNMWSSTILTLIFKLYFHLFWVLLWLRAGIGDRALSLNLIYIGIDL